MTHETKALHFLKWWHSLYSLRNIA